MIYTWALLVISYQRWAGVCDAKQSNVCKEARARWADYERYKAAIYAHVESMQLENETREAAAARLLSEPQVGVLELITPKMAYDHHSKVHHLITEINDGIIFFQPNFYTDRPTK